MEPYSFRDAEKKWQKIWADSKAFVTQESNSAPKSYILEMLPYPSGLIHMGHVRNYAIGDVLARYKRALGYNVLHPMGWDAFGLPAENAAAQHKTSPAHWTEQNISSMKAQLLPLGLTYDWDREISTCTPEYYGKEQKFFLEFYEKGLAVRKESWVNWDPVDHTVLANEQVINGRGWRSDALVEKKKLTQWSLRITQYAQELLDDLQHLEGWPEKVIRMQENWIGRSEGALIRFSIGGRSDLLEVFTTRPETLFGASFCAISPVHPLAEELAKSDEKLRDFIVLCQKTPTTEEAISTAEKLGFKTTLEIQHPFLPNVKLPLFVANFVLMDYGTGAIFACPAHDERDFDFAQKYKLPILPVIKPISPTETSLAAYTGPGVLENSGFLDGLTIDQARKNIIDEIENLRIGERRITFRLRDWCVSRQRYWGCPIPIIYCEDCGTVPVPEDQLPVRLPDDVSFEKSGNPLDHHPTWKHVACPICQKPALRETDTLDTFVDSSWYFLRYCNPTAEAPVDREACQKWMSVDWYIGGIEHAVLHLLYSRFFTKVLRDCGYLTIDEPFKNLLTQGMVCHQTFQDKKTREWLYPHEVTRVSNTQYVTVEGARPVVLGRSEKMSKSKKNLVDPQEIIDSYGADSARLFCLSDTPPNRDFEWNEEGVEGSWRYINRVWRLVQDVINLDGRIGNAEKSLKLRKMTHQSILKINNALERTVLNKAIAFLRELTHAIESALTDSDVGESALREATDVLILCLAPFTPYLASEAWEKLGHKKTLLETPWPEVDSDLAAVDQVTIAVQVNGKLRGSFETEVDQDHKTLEGLAFDLSSVIRETEGKPIKRVIVIPNRIVNIVV